MGGRRNRSGGTLERFQADRPGGSRESGPEASAREPSLVGPYVLLAEIGRGELATMHLAKKQSALGFQRLYALKRLKPALSGSLEHVELLLDEARLMSSIHHANIADVLDVGTDGGSYVVMEYVEGENLDSLLARAGAARNPRYVVPAVVDALHGLHALHTVTDDQGELSSIVHQAPRARHVLVGVDGTARLIDFSQVRAPNVRPSRCRSDRLKVAYMAPEMALHPDGVDLRADLFVVGITLWEALTGERLFAGDNDDQTFQNMLHRRVPRPSEVGLRPPRCFDAICMRALERDRSKRYGSALEMARDLRDMALNDALYATTAELGDWVRELAGKELRERRRSSGMDTPSSAGLELGTPTRGFERAGSGQSKPAALPAAQDAAQSAAAARALVVRDTRIGDDARAPSEEGALTPPVGMRRVPHSRAEAGEDAPTGRRSSIPEPLRPTLSTRPLSQNEELARAVTLPLVVQTMPAASEGEEPGAAERPDMLDDRDQTQPNRFVPSRPGARRDGRSASPGAYSQVESRRARAERPASGFDEAATTTHPAASARSSDRAPVARDRAITPPAGTRNRVSPLPARRITETPPTYVQRRDSNPTRMQIPEGPVGAPHRSFPHDDSNSDVHRVDARGPAQPQAKLGASSAAREPISTEEPRDQSHPRVRRPELTGLHLGMVDSLSPPAGATLTTPPEPPEPVGRSWPLWLASGVLAAIILLAVGVGVRQWIAGPSRALPSTRHAAYGSELERDSQGPAPERAATPVERAEPAVAPPATALPAAGKSPQAAPSSAAPIADRPPFATDRRQLRAGPRPSTARGAAQGQAEEPPVKRPRPAKSALSGSAGGLPENPY
jgi:serine/threonine protein kinase